MRDKVSIALAGIGGYGNSYLQELLGAAERSGQLIACVDPKSQRCTGYEELQARRIPIFPDLPSLYESITPDLLVIASPLHLHAEQTCFALERGSHVLCEKPMSATPHESQQMIAAQHRSGKLLAIGYQWSFAPGVHRLKSEIAAGRFGRPVRLSTSVCWPRGEKYYTRNNWAGRQKMEDGAWVFDSPVNNACAHYIQNMLYLLGDEPNTSDWPVTVLAELYRAHRIENYDTAMIRCKTRRQAELLFYVSHATQEHVDPVLRYEFEGAIITSGIETGGRIAAKLRDGTVIDYGRQPDGNHLDKLWQTVQSIQNGTPSACGPAAAAPQTAFMYAAQQSPPQIKEFPPSEIVTVGEIGDRATFVRGLQDVMDRCFYESKLPAELGIPWARPGRTVIIRDLENYQVSPDALQGQRP